MTTPVSPQIHLKAEPLLNYLLIKMLHIVSSTLLFGGGVSAAIIGSFVFRSRRVDLIIEQGRLLVTFDWYITVPTAIVQVATGIWMAVRLDLPTNSGWIGTALILLALAMSCWLLGIWLQHRMVAIAADSFRQSKHLPNRYFRVLNIWTWLGLPSTAAMLGIFYLMVFKNS